MELYESSSSTRIASSRRKKPKTSVNNIAGIGGMTRSGRCYASINSGTREGESSTANKRIKIAAPKRKDKKLINEPITEEKEDEFLKFIKHSEYSIVE